MSTWGSLKIGYDPAEFARAVELFARARDRFRGIETYRLDLIALQVQAASNEALGISGRVDAALRQGNRDAFENASNAFLGLGREIDGRLDADPFYRLQTYRDQAIRYGTTPAERQSCLRNALTLVTYWGGSGTQANEDNDYAFKAWSGLMTSYYLKRWESYFQFIRASWDNPGAPRPDFYSWERDWVDRNSSGPVP